MKDLFQTSGKIEITIKEWKEDFESFVNELDMPKDDYNGIMEYIYDGYALLKEQGAVEPTWSRGKPFCGACGLRIHGGKFCSECGKPILWKGR